MKRKSFVFITSWLILFLAIACEKFEEPVQKDKPQWEVFNTKNGITSNTIFCLEEYPQNTIWAGTMEGLYKFNSLNPMPTLYETLIALSLEASDNGLLVASNWGSLIIKENQIIYIDRSEVSTGMVSWGDFFWSTTYNKLKYSILSYAPITIWESEETEVRNLFADDDYIWVSTLGEGLLKVDKKTQKIIKNYKISDGLTSDTCLTTFLDSRDRMWIGVNSPTYGLLQILDNKIISYNFGFINSIAEDKEGNLWLGSLGHGIYKWEKNDNITNYTMLDGLPCNFINDILISDDGTVWIATDSGGIAKLKPENN